MGFMVMFSRWAMYLCFSLCVLRGVCLPCFIVYILFNHHVIGDTRSI